LTEIARRPPNVKSPIDFDTLAKKAMQKQTRMLQQMQKRQQNYFSQQQNKFMKTTNSEGGMREPRANQSILDTNIGAAKICACFSCCRPK